MLWVVCALIVVVLGVILGLWSGDASHPVRYNPDIRGPVLLVFAHPDDEAMFFTPILQYMRRVNIPVSFLCLTTGDADGLGSVREVELVRSAAFYGIPASRVTTLNVPQFRDGMRERWSPEAVAQAVQHHLSSSSSEGSSYFHTVITFDSLGVSSHPNHISTYQGVRLLAQKEKLKEIPVVAFRMLKTHPLHVKYGGLLSLVATLLWGPEGRLVSKEEKVATNSRASEEDSPLGEVLGKSVSAYQRLQAQQARYHSRRDGAAVPWVALIRPSQVLSSLTAMKEHRSQLVWFRYIFVAISSYTYYNVIDELK